VFWNTHDFEFLTLTIPKSLIGSRLNQN